jgi:hypothetical protein
MEIVCFEEDLHTITYGFIAVGIYWCKEQNLACVRELDVFGK